MSEEEQHYLVTIECRAVGFRDPRTAGRSRRRRAGRSSELDSAFIADAGRVDVTAIVSSHKRRELALEAIVGRFADMEGVVRVSWRRSPQGA